jgi:hypothetical protein
MAQAQNIATATAVSIEPTKRMGRMLFTGREVRKEGRMPAPKPDDNWTLTAIWVLYLLCAALVLWWYAAE